MGSDRPLTISVFHSWANVHWQSDKDVLTYLSRILAMAAYALPRPAESQSAAKIFTEVFKSCETGKENLINAMVRISTVVVSMSIWNTKLKFAHLYTSLISCNGTKFLIITYSCSKPLNNYKLKGYSLHVNPWNVALCKSQSSITSLTIYISVSIIQKILRGFSFMSIWKTIP